MTKEELILAMNRKQIVYVTTSSRSRQIISGKIAGINWVEYYFPKRKRVRSLGLVAISVKNPKYKYPDIFNFSAQFIHHTEEEAKEQMSKLEKSWKRRQRYLKNKQKKFMTKVTK